MGLYLYHCNSHPCYLSTDSAKDSKKFCHSMTCISKPFLATRDVLLAYINFSHFHKHHCADTTFALVSNLKNIHGYGTHVFTDPIVKQVLIGVQNREVVNPVPKNTSSGIQLPCPS